MKPFQIAPLCFFIFLGCKAQLKPVTTTHIQNRSQATLYLTKTKELEVRYTVNLATGKTYTNLAQSSLYVSQFDRKQNRSIFHIGRQYQEENYLPRIEPTCQPKCWFVQLDVNELIEVNTHLLQTAIQNKDYPTEVTNGKIYAIRIEDSLGWRTSVAFRLDGVSLNAPKVHVDFLVIEDFLLE